MKDLSGSIFSYTKYDLPAGLVVFLVALPLCLGIALASGAPLFAGIITGIVAGIVVGLMSGSQLAVSGPAAGLTVIVLNAIESLGSYEAFLLAVVLAGALQLVLGWVKAGIVSAYFPSAVIKGMLAAIGLILILKQIPHFLGVDQDFFGDDSFLEKGQNTFTAIINAFASLRAGALIVGVVALTIMLLWERSWIKNNKILGAMPGALVAVVASVLLNQVFASFFPSIVITEEHLVNIPQFSSFSGLVSELQFPDFSQLTNPDLYVVTFTIAVIASLETLLSIEATDKLDPLKRKSSTNKELRAQGVGNMLSGLIGGLPMTAVIVRSSTNIAAGGKTRMAAIYHGLFLAVCVLAIPQILNMIPLSALAAILILVGYKLSKVSLYKTMYKAGKDQFIPFIVTVVAILLTDLLVGITIGMAVGIFFILKANHKTPYSYDAYKESHEDIKKITINLSEHVSFLNKGRIALALETLPRDSAVEINGENTKHIDYDVLETIHNFKTTAHERNIQLDLVNIPALTMSSNGAH